MPTSLGAGTRLDSMVAQALASRFDFVRCISCWIHGGKNPLTGAINSLDAMLCRQSGTNFGLMNPPPGCDPYETPGVDYGTLFEIWRDPTGDELSDLGLFDWMMIGPWGGDYLSGQERADLQVASENVDHEMRDSLSKYVRVLEYVRADRGDWSRIVDAVQASGRNESFFLPPKPSVPDPSWFTLMASENPGGIVPMVVSVSPSANASEYKRLGLSMVAALWDFPLGVPWPTLKLNIQNSFVVDGVLRDYGWPYEPDFKRFWGRRQFAAFAVPMAKLDEEVDPEDVRLALTLNVVANMEAILQDLKDYYEQRQKNDEEYGLFQKFFAAGMGALLGLVAVPAIVSTGFAAATKVATSKIASDSARELKNAADQMRDSEAAFSGELQWASDRLASMAGPEGSGQTSAPASSGIPPWVWWAAGIAGAGIVGYILLRRGPSAAQARPPRGRLDVALVR